MFQPEHHQIDAGDAAETMLLIPADAFVERRFEISCLAVLRVVGALDVDAWHEMAVYADGNLQWRRRVPTHPGANDGLDYRFSRSVPVAQALRVLVRVQSRGGAQRQRLLVEADSA